MEFNQAASIYASDGKKAGSLYRVVVDPKTMEVTHIVIQKGLLVKEDKVIPVQEVTAASQDEVILRCTIDALKEMPALEIEKYETLSESPGVVPNYQTLEGGFHADPVHEYELITETKRTIPDDLIALKVGAEVVSTDDQPVGKVASVLTEPFTGKITCLIVAQGVFNQTWKAIPIRWVNKLDEDKVRLSAELHQVDELQSRSTL
jgi:sporulation protein YlmC with PRC-barrel domain